MKRDFLTLKDYTGEEIEKIIALAARVKGDKYSYQGLLKGKSIALLFDKHSTRTRLSFEAGITQLGGNSIYLNTENLQMKRGETAEDSARVMSGYLEGLVIRTFEQKTVETFALNSTIPVINGLTDQFHPCQALSDLFTIYELGLLNKSLRFTYVGDCNNVSNSLMVAFCKLGLDITVGCPQGYGPSRELMEYLEGQANLSGSKLNVIYHPEEAVRDAHIIYTDVWESMGDKHSQEKIDQLLAFQVNEKLLSFAQPGARVMHCLPAHRGMEITSGVMDGAHSIVFQQAENRLHAQKALMIYLYS